jgi:hypothetical protein
MSGYLVVNEPQGMFAAQNPRCLLRPDLSVSGFSEKISLIDVGISTIVPANLSINQASIRDYAISLYRNKKLRKYSELADLSNYNFIPLILDTRGSWDSSVKVFFNKLVSTISIVSGIDEHILNIYWTRRLSMCLNKSIADSIIKKTARLHTLTMSDESSWLNNIEDQVGFVGSFHAEAQGIGDQDLGVQVAEAVEDVEDVLDVSVFDQVVEDSGPL